MNPGPAPSRSKHVWYLAGAIVSLTLMSLCWALDEFFVDVFLGIAVYFLFLYYWTRPRTTASFETPSQETERPYERSTRTFQSSDNIESLSAKKSRVTALIIVAVFFGMFVLVFSLVLLSRDDDDNGDKYRWAMQADQFSNNGDYDSAKFFYRKVFSADEKDKSALIEYGNVLLKEQHYDSALIYYYRTIALDAQYEPALYNVALTKYYQEEYSESITQCRSLLEINAEYGDAEVLIGDCYYQQSNYDSAIFWYERGHANGVETAALSHVMAYIYDVKHDYDRAIPLYKEAVNFDSTKTDVCARLGELISGPEGEAYRKLAQVKN
jgi:tetratricopeptide (TPR) repeat protein